MKFLKYVLPFILAISVAIPVFVLFMPLLIIVGPFIYFKRERFENQYADFLINNNGADFFCYNTLENSKKNIEQNSIANLEERIEIVYLNGQKVASNHSVEFISQALYRLKNYNQFPHLMKIRDGKRIDKSINNPFYNVQNLNKPKTELVDQINQFFEVANYCGVKKPSTYLRN